MNRELLEKGGKSRKERMETETLSELQENQRMEPPYTYPLQLHMLMENHPEVRLARSHRISMGRRERKIYVIANIHRSSLLSAI